MWACCAMRSTSKDAFRNLLKDPRIWRGREVVADAGAVSTGYPRLDERLPGGGWVSGALTEIAVERYGVGELRLLIPALKTLSEGDRWIVWVAPPFIPYAPALASAGINLSRVLLVHPVTETDALWAMAQALRAGVCAAVLAWAGAVAGRELRQLQLAAATGASLGILFRPLDTFMQASPAALRLKLVPEGKRLKIELIKVRGGYPAEVWLTPVSNE